MKLGRLAEYFREQGVISGAVLTADRLLGRQAPEIPYQLWLERSRPSSGDYMKMEKESLPYNPVIGVRASMPPEGRISFFQSLEMQVYRNFRALKNCPQAEYILIADRSCTLRPDLLYECALLLNQAEEGDIDLIYFDSDRIGEDGRKQQPSFRPEFDPELLEQVNYMGSVVLVRAQAAYEAGLPAAGEKAFHDFLKRVCLPEAWNSMAGSDGPEQSVRESAEWSSVRGPVRHIPKVLYHKDGKAALPGGSPGAEGGGNDTDSPALSRIPSGMSLPPDTGREPLISVLIPNRDHVDDLKRCIDSLLEVNTWKNLEILILENHSSSGTFDLYRQMQESDPRIRVLNWDREFNYSAINNFGARHAKGEYLLLLNNDTRILEPQSIAFMHQLSSRQGVGAVGALLCYPDGSVQHGGIILGKGGIAGHAFEGRRPMEEAEPFPRMVFSHTHNVSAVTGACMMLPRSVWNDAGGMDERLEVTFNDVDLCMRLRSASLRILMCPAARLVHYESASRGSEDTPEKVARFHREIRIFVHRWEKELQEGDPFYNPNLTLLGKDWTCRDARRETVKPYRKYMEL